MLRRLLLFSIFKLNSINLFIMKFHSTLFSFQNKIGSASTNLFFNFFSVQSIIEISSVMIYSNLFLIQKVREKNYYSLPVRPYFQSLKFINDLFTILGIPLFYPMIRLCLGATHVPKKAVLGTQSKLPFERRQTS